MAEIWTTLLVGLAALMLAILLMWVATRNRPPSPTFRRFGGPCACTQDDHCSCCVYFAEYNEDYADGDSTVAEAFRGSWDDIHSVALCKEYKAGMYYSFQSGWIERGKQESQ